MTIEEYYTAPSEEIFDDFKQAAIAVWNTYDDTYGYASGKIAHIKELTNVKDNYAHIVAMFDASNKIKMFMQMQRPDSSALMMRLLKMELEQYENLSKM